MNVIHILQGISDLTAGPTYSVSAISHYLDKYEDCNVKIVATGYKPDKWHYKLSLVLFNSYLDRFGLLSIETIKFYLNVISYEDTIIHEHGIWRSMNVLPLIGKRCSSLVWSPRGMFSDWSMKHHRYIKFLFWHLLQKPCLKKIDCFHATSETEVEDIRRLGFKQPIAVISNGVSLPKQQEISIEKQNVIVFLSRIHTKKGVHLLINSWNKIADQFPGWTVKIAGKIDSAYAREMKTLSESLNVPRLQFLGPVYNEEKTKLLASSSLFVLPTYSENFGIAIAEALACSTPVITTINTPWNDLDRNKCGWCIENNEASLISTIRTALSKPVDELAVMGSNGRAWMEEEFSWEQKASEMKEVYEWLSDRANKPSSVLL